MPLDGTIDGTFPALFTGTVFFLFLFFPFLSLFLLPAFFPERPEFSACLVSFCICFFLSSAFLSFSLFSAFFLRYSFPAPEVIPITGAAAVAARSRLSFISSPPSTCRALALAPAAASVYRLWLRTLTDFPDSVSLSLIPECGFLLFTVTEVFSAFFLTTAFFPVCRCSLGFFFVWITIGLSSIFLIFNLPEPPFPCRYK